VKGKSKRKSIILLKGKGDQIETPNRINTEKTENIGRTKPNKENKLARHMSALKHDAFIFTNCL